MLPTPQGSSGKEIENRQHFPNGTALPGQNNACIAGDLVHAYGLERGLRECEYEQAVPMESLREGLAVNLETVQHNMS